MKLRHRMLLAIDILLGKKRNLAMTIFMLFCTFLLFLLVVTLLAEQEYDIKKYQKCFRYGTNQTFHVQINSIPNEEINNPETEILRSLYTEGKSIDEVTNFGMYTIVTLRFAELFRDSEYISVMRERPRERAEANIQDGASKVLFADCAMFEIMRTSMDGKLPSGWDEESNEVPLIAGCALQGIVKIGDVLHLNGAECRIVGFTEEGDLWPADGFVAGKYNQVNELSYSFVAPMWFAVKSFSGLTGINSIYYTTKSGEKSAARHKLRDVTDSNGIQAEFTTVDEQMKIVYEDRQEAVKTYRKLLIFMILLSLLTAVSSSVIACMMRSREIGIWYANGVLPQDVVCILFIEQVIKIVVSAVFAYFVGRMGEMSSVYRQIYLSESFAWLVILATIMLIVATLGPVLYIINKKPMQLLSSKG